jgi:Fe-S-cluster containining protein
MLVKLHREIDSRTREIAASHGDWLCRRGCDMCCRNLAELPRLTKPEWDLVEQGLAQLPDAVRQAIFARIEKSTRVCPFLDPAAGNCLIYEHRPVACRTYGFYVERDRGLYCKAIEARVETGEMANVVWGNAAAVDATLEELGEKISLSDWLRSFPGPAPTPPSDPPDPCGER